MRTAKPRPAIRVRVHYEGKRSLVDAYAEVYAQILKSSEYTIDNHSAFQYNGRKGA